MTHAPNQCGGNRARARSTRTCTLTQDLTQRQDKANRIPYRQTDRPCGFGSKVSAGAHTRVYKRRHACMRRAVSREQSQRAQAGQHCCCGCCDAMHDCAQRFSLQWCMRTGPTHTRRHHRQNTQRSGRGGSHAATHQGGSHAHTTHYRRCTQARPPERCMWHPTKHRSTGFQPLSLSLLQQPTPKLQQWDLTQQAGPAAAGVAAAAVALPQHRRPCCADTVRWAAPYNQVPTAPAAPAALLLPCPARQVMLRCAAPTCCMPGHLRPIAKAASRLCCLPACTHWPTRRGLVWAHAACVCAGRCFTLPWRAACVRSAA